MNTFLKSCLRGTLKGLGGLALGILGLFGICLLIGWMASQNNRSPYEWEQRAKFADITARANAAATAAEPLSRGFEPGAEHVEFQKLIIGMHPNVGFLNFVSPRLIRVQFSGQTGKKPGICQAIANLWSFRSGEKNVSAQCWEGDQCVALGTVEDGNLVNVKP